MRILAVVAIYNRKKLLENCLIALCTKEILWLHSNMSVGVWYQPEMPRLSRRYPTEFASFQIAQALINLSKKLDQRDALSIPRKNAIAKGLWQCYMDGYKYNPLKWVYFAKKAKEFDDSSRPNSRIHNFLFNLGIPIMLATLLILPTDFMFHVKRKLHEKKLAKIKNI